MQLDIFEHSRDVILRNAAIDALRRRDAGECSRAVSALAAEYSADPLMPAFTRLCENLHSAVPKPLQPEAAMALLQEIEGTVAAAAQAVFGPASKGWLSPLWSDLAASISDYPFDSACEDLHAAPLLLRAERWADAIPRIEGIESWRRQPAPMAWMIEARYQIAGFDGIWPLLAELAWMDGKRAQYLSERLCLLELERAMRSFDTDFEGDGTVDYFAWFPAWAVTCDSRLANGLRLAQKGANTRQEYCARLVLDLLWLERKGRHAELVDNRRKLREANPVVFARYMQDR